LAGLAFGGAGPTVKKVDKAALGSRRDERDDGENYPTGAL